DKIRKVSGPPPCSEIPIFGLAGSRLSLIRDLRSCTPKAPRDATSTKPSSVNSSFYVEHCLWEWRTSTTNTDMGFSIATLIEVTRSLFGSKLLPFRAFAMWQLTRHSFGTDFVSFIDRLIAETSVDQKSVHRDWSELVAARRAAM